MPRILTVIREYLANATDGVGLGARSVRKAPVFRTKRFGRHLGVGSGFYVAMTGGVGGKAGSGAHIELPGGGV